MSAGSCFGLKKIVCIALSAYSLVLWSDPAFAAFRGRKSHLSKATWVGKILTTGGTCTAGVGNFTGGWCYGGTSDTTAGSGNGMFNFATGVAVDAKNDNFFVADTQNNRIQKFVLSTGAFVGWIGKIKTTGGTCTAGVGNFTGGWCSGGTSETANTGIGNGMFNLPYGIAVDSANNFLYIADSANHRIQKFVLSTGAFVGWVGRIAVGGGTCTAGVGNFTGGWCSGGSSGTGTGNGMFNAAYHLAIDVPNDLMYVPDGNNHRIQKFTLSTGAFVGWLGRQTANGGTCTAGSGNFTGGWCSGSTGQTGTGNGMFNTPVSVELDTLNNVMLVSDANNSRIQKFTLSTGVFVGWLGKISATGGTCNAGANLFTGGWCSGGTSTSGTGDGMFNATGDMAINVGGNALYVNDRLNGRIEKFVLSTGAFIGWIGKIATTGGSCTTGANLFSAGWCQGGTSTTGTGDGMLWIQFGLDFDFATNSLLIGDTILNRVTRISSF